MIRAPEQYTTGYIAGGRYEIVRSLDSGAMGSLYEALDKRVSKRVAIKFLSRTLVSDETVTKRFEREARALGQINHDHVCDVSDYGVTDDGTPYIVMDLLDGEPLSEMLKREGRLSPQRAIEIMLQVLAALSAAHELKIIHRDLKPGNIFMDRGSMGETRAKLIDFGIAKHLDASFTVTEQGQSIGTPLYMSPEQAGGIQEDIGPRSDLWAIGVILYECLTGTTPFTGHNFRELLANILLNEPQALRDHEPTLPPALEAVINKSLEKTPGDRFSDSEELAAALMDVQAKYIDNGTRVSDTTPSIPPAFGSETRERISAEQGESAPQELSPSVTPKRPAVDPMAETDATPLTEEENGGLPEEEIGWREDRTKRNMVFLIVAIVVVGGGIGFIASGFIDRSNQSVAQPDAAIQSPPSVHTKGVLVSGEGTQIPNDAAPSVEDQETVRAGLPSEDQEPAKGVISKPGRSKVSRGEAGEKATKALEPQTPEQPRHGKSPDQPTNPVAENPSPSEPSESPERAARREEIKRLDLP